ncbi:MAG: transposase family protein [Patescibacteria group bacterium]
MQSRNQYLKELRTEYLKTKSKKKRGTLLDEAEKRTCLNRKYLIDKLRPKSNLDKLVSQRKQNKQYYDNYVKTALVRMWEIFDYPCGQRLKPLLTTETEKLRKLSELECSDIVAKKLEKIGSATIDRKLKHQKEVERLNRKYHHKIHPLLYQKIPVKVFAEQDRTVLGNTQIDLVEHCGQSVIGEFINTLSITDISSGWWEGEAIMGKGQQRTFLGLEGCKTRFPLTWQEIHSDNGTEFINWHLLKYAHDQGLRFSRSRPYKKNDNCLVEQKNWTHVKKFVGYARYETIEELDVLNDLYRNELRLFKNFFQPVIKLISKERINGKIHRRYDVPKTPYARLLESNEITEKRKQELKRIYQSSNPAQLKRTIDNKLNILYQINQKVDVNKKISVRFQTTRPEPVSVR